MPSEPCVCGCELRAEIATLNGVINAIVDEPVSMLLAQAANLVRLVGPDDWPVDAIPRSSVVDMAMRVKDAADRQRSIARDKQRFLAAAAPAARRYFETVLEANDGCCLSDADDRAKVLEALCALFS